MGQFKIPPVSTLLGSTLTNFFRVLKKGHISPKYYHKITFTLLIILIATPFHWWEELSFRRKLRRFRFDKPPLFILGHWRSGTTLLHNMLCLDPRAGYVTTYQSILPNNLASKWLFKTFMKMKIPSHRPSDNMPLGPDMPQEEELAFANCQPYAFYVFFYFPSKYKVLYDKSVYHKGLTLKEKDTWYRLYDKLLKKALINTGGERLIVKNPVNTARIRHILKMYPDARFLYIYRNPVSVFLSTRLFLQHLLPAVTLEKYSNEAIEEIVYVTYNRLLNDYFEQKDLIPAGHLLEIRYEDFIANPVDTLDNVYHDLLHEDFSDVKERFHTYRESLESYIKNKYVIDRTTIEKIRERLGKFLEYYHYDIPEEVEIRK